MRAGGQFSPILIDFNCICLIVTQNSKSNVESNLGNIAHAGLESRVRRDSTKEGQRLRQDAVTEGHRK